jgi:hypothetical protein
MNEEERDVRWQAIMEARAEIAEDPVPLHPDGARGAGRRSGRKSQRFNEALSDLGSWSSVEASRRRLSA